MISFWINLQKPAEFSDLESSSYSYDDSVSVDSDTMDADEFDFIDDVQLRNGGYSHLIRLADGENQYEGRAHLQLVKSSLVLPIYNSPFDIE